MMEAAKVETRALNGVRIVVHSGHTYDDVLAKLRSPMGASNADEIVVLAKKPITEAEFARTIEDRLVGESGSMLFAEIDHGGFARCAGVTKPIQTPAIRPSPGMDVETNMTYRGGSRRTRISSSTSRP